MIGMTQIFITNFLAVKYKGIQEFYLVWLKRIFIYFCWYNRINVNKYCIKIVENWRKIIFKAIVNNTIWYLCKYKTISNDQEIQINRLNSKFSFRSVLVDDICIFVNVIDILFTVYANHITYFSFICGLSKIAYLSLVWLLFRMVGEIFIYY